MYSFYRPLSSITQTFSAYASSNSSRLSNLIEPSFFPTSKRRNTMLVCDKCSKKFHVKGFSRHHLHCKGADGPTRTIPAIYDATPPTAPAAAVPDHEEMVSAVVAEAVTGTAADPAVTSTPNSSAKPADDFQCEQCEKTFRSKSGLSKHAKTAHNGKKRKIVDPESSTTTVESNPSTAPGEKNNSEAEIGETLQASLGTGTAAGSVEAGSSEDDASPSSSAAESKEPNALVSAVTDHAQNGPEDTAKKGIMQCALCGEPRSSTAMKEHQIYCKWKQEFLEERFRQQKRLPG